MTLKSLTEQQKQDLYRRAIALGVISGEMTGYPSIDKPWLKYYSEDAVISMLPEYSMFEYIYNQNKDNLKRIAMNYYGTNITYGKMFEQIEMMASSLEAEGIKQGDVVTISMLNAPETVCLIFALNKIGAVANMIYGADTPEEIQHHLLNAHSTFVFTLDMFLNKFLSILDTANLKRIVVASPLQSMSKGYQISARLLKHMTVQAIPEDPRFCSWKQFFRKTHRKSRTCHLPDAPAVITYTGGTTGGSKGVVLSNKAINSAAQQYIVSENNLHRTSTWMQVLPLFIAFGIANSMMFPLAIGMTQIIRIPMSETITEFSKKFKPNHILHGPAYWERFAEDNEDLDLSTFIAPTTGGDSMRPSVERKINAYLKSHGCPTPLMNGYGMTEVGAGVAANHTHAYKFGSVGIPYAKNIIAAFDTESMDELTYGQEGEICVQAPSIMLEYINNQEETNNVIRLHKNGDIWVHTGDLGYVDEDGFVFISGRVKRYYSYVIDGTHKKVFTLDIEKTLLKNPMVENCAVVPVPNEKTLQAPVAYIILNREYRGLTNPKEQLTAYVKDTLTVMQQPIEYYFVEELPLTKIGKVDYLTLERKAAEVFISQKND